MSVRIALLTSPLLGPAVWDPVRDELDQAGWGPVIAAHEGPAPSSAQEVVSAFVAALTPTDEWVLVPHSNAGLVAPSVARQRRVRAVVYVDARLPGNGIHRVSSVKSFEFYSRLVDNDGFLPPWCDWWDDDIGPLFRSDASRRQCESEMRRLPLRYYESVVDGTGWADLPSAYLAFGDVYAAERDRASAAGFATATIDGAAHLHQLIDPAGVAHQIEQLVDELGVTAG